MVAALLRIVVTSRVARSPGGLMKRLPGNSTTGAEMPNSSPIYGHTLQAWTGSSDSSRRAAHRSRRCFMKPTGDRLLQPNSTDSGPPAQLSAETNRLFVYGTLLLDDVISALIGRIPHYQRAVAPGWQVVCLPQRVYPGL